MSDFFVKPGNQEHGWNDPPQFSYGLQKELGSQKKNHLNKRVHAQDAAGLVSGSSSAPVSLPTPPRDSNPPPMCGGPSAPPGPRVPAVTAVASDAELSVEDVRETLYFVLEMCRPTVKKQVCDDVERRLKLFEDMWTSGKLSSLVKQGMHRLSKEMKSKHWEAADEIHRGLMVDHVSEVSQWMVGVKRLINEASNMNPDSSSQVH